MDFLLFVHIFYEKGKSFLEVILQDTYCALRDFFGTTSVLV